METEDTPEERNSLGVRSEQNHINEINLSDFNGNGIIRFGAGGYKLYKNKEGIKGYDQKKEENQKVVYL